MKAFVTGGAGFIGSHLADALVARGDDVTVVDDLSAGSHEHVQGGVRLIEGDAGDAAILADALPGAEAVWHLAADAEVRTAATDPQRHFQQNVAVTWNLLEACRRAGVKRLVFTSTSAVHGRATVMPTPEDYGPMLPISIYGGAKLACEGLIASAAATFGFDAQMFRFANVVGPRARHGVIPDFIAKLRADPDRLEILGDGTQCKSYVHVADTVAAMLHAADHAGAGVHVYNIGSDDSIPVTDIAHIVADEMGLAPVHAFAGGAPDGAGWTGDVKHMGLDCSALKALGWRPSMDSGDAVRAAVRALLQ